MDDRRHSPRSISRKQAGVNVKTPSESSTSRRASRSNVLQTPTPSVSSIRPKMRKITDYMSVATDPAQSRNGECDQESNNTKFPTSGFLTPTDSFSPSINGTLESSPLKLPRDSVPLPTGLNPGPLSISNYPWNNNPIAVAIWVAQKIERAKPIISPASSSLLSSRRSSQAGTPQKSETLLNFNERTLTNPRNRKHADCPLGWFLPSL
jgi:hypothetical protein